MPRVNHLAAKCSMAGIALAIHLTACHSAARSAGPDPVMPRSPLSAAGCYRMVLGDWVETGALHGITPPLEFRLDTALAPGGQAQGATRRTVATPIPGQASRFTRWSLDTGDTLRVLWSTGHVGGGYTLTARGDSVFGRATTFADSRRAGTPDPTAPARGVRIGCD